MRSADALPAARSRSGIGRFVYDYIPVVPFCRHVMRAEIVEVVPILTLCLMIFQGYRNWLFSSGTALLTITALLYQPLLRKPVFWLAATVLAAASILDNWYPVDNHKYLLCYWVAVLFVTFNVSKEYQETVLVVNARYFLVAVMGLAAVQKLISDNYIDSTFFEFTFLIDPRFNTFLNVFGVDSLALEENRSTFDEFRRAYLTEDMVTADLTVPPIVPPLAFLVTWWTVLIEAVIAALFLLCRDTADKLGHVLLIVFILTTYIVAPVFGFGFTVAILGYVLCPPRWALLRLSYIACILLLEFYSVPWRRVFGI
jgi:hypothetical protein